MKSLIIRKATNKDESDVLKLFCKSDRELTKTKITKNYLKNMKIIINNHLNKRNSLFLIAERNGRIVGYLFGFLQKGMPLDKKFTQVRLEDVYILFSERKKGMAKEFLKEFYSWTKTKKIKKIFLGTNSKHKKSISFWKKQGFKVVWNIMRKDIK